MVDHPHADAPIVADTAGPVGDGASRTGDVPGFRYTVEALSIHPDGPAAIVVLRVFGEVDLLTQHSLEAGLRSSVQAGSQHLLVDLVAVGFCSAGGLGILCDAARTAAEHRIGYAVCGLSPPMRRAAGKLWEPGRPVRYRSLAVAVTTIRAMDATTG